MKLSELFWKPVDGMVGGTLILLVMFGSFGCTDDCETTQRFIYQEPVFMPLADLRSSFEVSEPQVLAQTGKIYYREGYLFINEPGEGIHIIDNQDPRSPRNISFIEIPGNVDMAVSGNTLYADRYMDLVVIDISNVEEPVLVKTLEDVFQNFDSFGLWVDPVQGVVVDWVEQVDEQVLVSECDNVNMMYYDELIFFRTDQGIAANESISSIPGGAGVGGSMARFTISEEFLYTVDSWTMQVFNISNLTDPVPGNRIDLGWGIETIFPYQDKLFLGANNGMHIYDRSNPELPSYVSTYEHITSCDPVVVEGNYAYVTLRSGTECQGFTNQLDVIDVSDAFNPRLEISFPMQNPHGLGIDNGTLFICEGEFGLKVFDADSIQAIDENLTAHFEDIHAFDVIPLNGLLIMIGEDGLYQYDYNDDGSVVEFLSHLPVTGIEQ